MKVDRQTLTANTQTTFNISSRGTVTIKNFTDGDIYAAIGINYDKDNAICIPSNTAQVIEARDVDIIVVAESGGIVEIDS